MSSKGRSFQADFPPRGLSATTVVPSPTVLAYIGTDDLASGSLAGKRMSAILPDGGEVALLGGIADNINSGRRLSGFEHGIRGSRVKVVARVNADYSRTK